MVVIYILTGCREEPLNQTWFQKIKRTAIFSLLHLKTAQVQNGRPDGDRAPRAPTDAPMGPLGIFSLIHSNKPDYEKKKPIQHCIAVS